MAKEKKDERKSIRWRERCYSDQQFPNTEIINSQLIRVPHRALYNLTLTYLFSLIELLLCMYSRVPGTLMVHFPSHALAHADPSVLNAPLLPICLWTILRLLSNSYFFCEDLSTPSTPLTNTAVPPCGLPKHCVYTSDWHRPHYSMF